MTALDLVVQGVRFVRVGGVLHVRAHAARVDLAEAVRAEVARRVLGMASPPRLEVPRAGACEACGDVMASHRGGWCVLCELARKKALAVKAEPSSTTRAA